MFTLVYTLILSYSHADAYSDYSNYVQQQQLKQAIERSISESEAQQANMYEAMTLSTQQRFQPDTSAMDATIWNNKGGVQGYITPD